MSDLDPFPKSGHIAMYIIIILCKHHSKYTTHTEWKEYIVT